jgi:FkbM family methyltransferase
VVLRRMRNRVVQAVRSAVLPAGHTHVRADRPWAPPDAPLRFITARRPDVVLDVGANHGQFAAGLRAAGYAGRVVSFEPQPEAFAALQRRAAADPAWECHPFALGDVEELHPMHVSGFSESSSLLPIGKAHVDLMPSTRVVGCLSVSVKRLDQVADRLGLAGRRFVLKLDVQGYESAVLRGAGEWLGQADAAVVELNFAPLFDGQSAYYEVMDALETAGLRFFSLVGFSFHPTTNAILWADGLFARHPE